MDANIDPRLQLQEPDIRPLEPTSSTDINGSAGSVPGLGLRPSRSDYQPSSGLQGCAPAPSLPPSTRRRRRRLSAATRRSSFSLLTAIELEAGWTRPSCDRQSPALPNTSPASSLSPTMAASSTVVGDVFCSRPTVGEHDVHPSDYQSPPALPDPTQGLSPSPLVAALSTIKNSTRLTVEELNAQCRARG
ncbi:hypothetical protein EDB92DRAFT_1577461 [Lactarius akahatsu]|uniref:Uncharacterized protein n=1 Tax=Lactarius akahatsu TaxID=416441 RepID=A0AAD4Q4C6_9AGAM|nr:hypothetical protein EDB92DRAFT_1577461 [Lactarius akahatsu]